MSPAKWFAEYEDIENKEYHQGNDLVEDDERCFAHTQHFDAGIHGW